MKSMAETRRSKAKKITNTIMIIMKKRRLLQLLARMWVWRLRLLRCRQWMKQKRWKRRQKTPATTIIRIRLERSGRRGPSAICRPAQALIDRCLSSKRLRKSWKKCRSKRWWAWIFSLTDLSWTKWLTVVGKCSN